MDATHLIAKYFGTLLMKCACDAQNYIFPIAFAIVELGNKDSQALFLVQQWDQIVDMEHYVVITSDRQKG